MVSRELDHLGIEFLILDHTDKSPITVNLSDVSLTTGGRTILLDDVKLAWYRSKFDHALFGSGDGFRNNFVAANAWKDTTRAIWMLLGERAVNSYISVQKASVKIDQLVTAKSFDFSIPRTIISNSYKDILEWSDGCSPSIVKAIENAAIPDPAMPLGYSSMMTTRVDWDLFRRDPEVCAIAPTLFQGEIQKAFELRIAVQGDRIFASRIDSASKPYMEVDWRYGSAICDYVPFVLPDDVVRKIKSYLSHYGLYSGQFDFVVDRDGVYWFLECNPQGYWAFLDEGWGYEVSKSFARGLKDLYETGIEDRPFASATATRASHGDGIAAPFENRLQ
jgi:hypothetical protein